MKSLNKDSDNKKSRDSFIEATRTVELVSFDEVEGLAETMFKGGKEWETDWGSVGQGFKICGVGFSWLCLCEANKKKFGTPKVIRPMA